MTRALVPLAEGAEEMEAVIVIDILRRAAWQVTTAGLDAREVTCSRGVVLKADCSWFEVDPKDFDVLILPGGAEGTARLSADKRILDAIRWFANEGRTLGAICAGPLALQAAGVLDGRRATCHPAVSEKLSKARYENSRVVVDGNIVTSQAAGTSFEFALAVLKHCGNQEDAAAIEKTIVLR